jgi:hypothetical protein
MKTVFNTSREVAHVWASQSQNEGDTSGRGNFYFRGPVAYSYGSHFIAGIIVTRKGRKAALITTCGHSRTTAGHIGDVRSATRHMNRFFVPLNDETIKPGELFASYHPRVLEAIKKAKTARLRREYYIEEAKRLVFEANDFADFYGLKSRLEMPASIDDALAEAKKLDDNQKRRKSAQLKRETAARLEREKKSLAEAKADLSLWKKGKNDYVRHSLLLGKNYLRVSADGKEIETSDHASVSVAHAHRAYKILARLRERHETYVSNGHTIRCGRYTVYSLDESGHVEVGCHSFEWLEVERIAKLLKWDSTEPMAEP